MIVGIDCPSLFTKDNFTSRRTTGHNMYDPELPNTGAEINAGFTYTNSSREWHSQGDYLGACLGLLTCDQIVRRAPRVLLTSIPRLITGITIEEHQEAQ